MNWSEAFAEWNAIQVAQGRQKIHLKHLTETLILKNQEANKQLNEPSWAQRVFNGVAGSLARLVKTVSSPTMMADTELPASEETPTEASPASLSNVRQNGALSSVLNKLVAQLDQAQRMIEEFLYQNGELFKRVMGLVRGWQEGLMAAFAQSARLLAPAALKKVFKRALRTLVSWLGFAEEPEEESEAPKSAGVTKKTLRVWQ